MRSRLRIDSVPDWGKKHLRPARVKAGLSRQQLSILTGVADSTIRNIELGTNLPSERVGQALSCTLGLPKPWLEQRLESFDRSTMAAAAELVHELLRQLLLRRAKDRLPHTRKAIQSKANQSNGYFVYLAMHEHSHKAAQITKKSTLPLM